MSSDGKDSGSVWQEPTNKAKRRQQQAQFASQEEPQAYAPPLLNDTYAADMSLSANDNDELVDDVQDQPAATPLDTAKSLFRQGSPILIPLILAGLTSLLVLPLIMQKRASVPPENLWLIVAIIVVVAIAEIVTLFYANANDGLRVSAMIGGFFPFILVSSFAISGPIAGFIVLAALLVLAVLLTRYYFHPVTEGFVDIIYAFGQYSRTLYTGPNILFPWEKVAHQLKVSERQWLCPLQRVQLSRTEDVLLHALVSYQLLPEDAHLAVTQVNEWEKQFQDLFITQVQTIGTMFSPDDFISWPEGLHTPSSAEANADSLARRERVNDYLYHQVRDRAALWGIMVHWVGIRDVMLAPHDTEIDTEVLLTPPQPEQAEQPPVDYLSNTTQADAALPVTAQPASASPASNEPFHQQATSSSSALPRHLPSLDHQPQVSPPRVLKEEILKKAYKEVQDGKVTDPSAIREIAANFHAIASDPHACELVSFDAERAAQNLYEQANKYEERYLGKPGV